MALSVLVIGFLLGMRHSLEADHLAAVATLATRSSGFGDSLRQGAAWGLGHTLTLVLFGSIVLWTDLVVPEVLSQGLQLAVGVLLVLLGIEVLWRLARDRVHFHTHTHTDGNSHFHAHSHAGEGRRHDAHRHSHPKRLPMRALYIGLIHGMAGSSALILLTLQTVESPWTGMLYILLFGTGSLVGMALLSLVIVFPLRRSPAAGLTWVHRSLHLLVGLSSTLLGGMVVAANL